MKFDELSDDAKIVVLLGDIKARLGWLIFWIFIFLSDIDKFVK